MSDSLDANQLKDLGNQHFKNKDYEGALKNYSLAIEKDPTNHVLYSNRSICYFNLNNFSNALSDAQNCIKFKNDFAKGYQRQGAAYFKLNKTWDALCSYSIAFLYDPNSEPIKTESIEIINFITSSVKGNIPKLMSNPKAMEFLKDPNYLNIMNKMKKPNCVDVFETARAYPSYVQLISVCLEESVDKINEDVKTYYLIKHSIDNKGEGEHQSQNTSNANNSQNSNKEPTHTSHSSSHSEKFENKSEKSTSNNKHTDDDNGLAHYNLGNQLFLWKRYKDALKEFQLAIKQFPKNFKFFYSRALCHFKLKEYDQCIESCEHVAKLIEENHEDLLVHTFILSARALVCVKDLDEAETMFRKAFKAGGEALHDVVQIAYDKFKSK